MSCISAQKEWLLEWNKLIQPVRSLTLPDEANRISTPLKLHSWAEALQEFDPTKELIKEFKERFEFYCTANNFHGEGKHAQWKSIVYKYAGEGDIC